MNRAQWRDRLENAAPEQVYETLSRLLPLVNAEDLICLAPVITARIPELKPLVGFDQRSPHHAYDLYTHVAHVVAGVPEDLTLRWAALLHDIGKIDTFTQDETGRGHYYGHATVSAKMARDILRRMRAPEALGKQTAVLIENHMTRLVPDKDQLRCQMDALGWETLHQLLRLQKADMSSKGTGKLPNLESYAAIERILEELREETERLVGV